MLDCLCLTVIIYIVSIIFRKKILSLSKDSKLQNKKQSMLFTYSAGIFSILKKTAGTFITKDSCHSHSHERAGIRTPDNLIKSQVLYHLSYTPVYYFHSKENAQSRNRTSDTRIFSPLLYRLSYLGISY